jgi:hypothetical protein
VPPAEQVGQFGEAAHGHTEIHPRHGIRRHRGGRARDGDRSRNSVGRGRRDLHGTLTGTYPAIVVPDGETCTLDGAQVKGNVKVGIGSTLMTADAMIKGNVFGQQAMRVHIIDTDVWGQIHFRRTRRRSSSAMTGARSTRMPTPRPRSGCVTTP